MHISHRKAVWLMVSVTLMWSIAGVVTRQLHSASGFEVTFWRSFFTLVSLPVILLLWQGKAAFARIPWKSRTLWISALCWAGMFTCFMLALTLTTVANVLITLAIAPLCTALLARFFLHQRIAPRTWAAILVAGCGIAWMYASQIQFDGEFSVRGLMTAFVLLLTPLAGSVQWMVLQRSQMKSKNGQGEKIDMIPAVMLGAAISVVLTLPAAWPLQTSGTDLAWLALLGLVQLAIPSTLAVICSRVLKAPEISLLGLLEIIFGIAWAWLGAGEEPGANVLAGGALVIAALAGNELLGWRENSRLGDDDDHDIQPSILS
jgi:drug/metabolite transporter (DMT)-like permease